ncbi:MULTISPECIES: dihydroneopterin aldolase [Arthrobacter]|uniref:7,8-dihydroneopterin aldolase n=1 Tax=Arthrobacter sunyaminii TaxID=2816859 RepID=A0A975S5U4_9MICC|nr:MULTISPECIES: dihydroneopterin aldolase [Arthrobacter]MBO0909310.1 dihydroneopterin aldolase [Arthrobacter sunyaminii]QWQ36362.1 dihydroneopterin aldolase [Arthrobacter sunyaminii]
MNTTNASDARTAVRGVRDTITLTGITAQGFHGVFEEERRNGQPFVVDLVLHADLQPAGISDDLTKTAHYGVLAEQVAAIISGEPLNLIEALAERIAAAVLGDFAGVDAVEVTVHKPQAPITVPFGDVSVTIRRSRS